MDGIKKFSPILVVFLLQWNSFKAHAQQVQQLQIESVDLARAKATALANQPAVKAARASLAAAIARRDSINNLRVPTCLQRDLPIRREQSALGPIAGEASVKWAELNTVYAVQYAYISYLFALSQQRVAEDSIKGLKQLDTEVVSKYLQGNDKKEANNESEIEIFQADKARLLSMIELASGKREEAIHGAKKALSALSEAMAITPTCSIHIPGDHLLDANPELTLESLLQLAQANRPEIIQAKIATQVHGLEVAAQQARSRKLSLRTFTTGSDIHSQPLPAGSFEGGEYKPGAVGPEMPIQLSGKVCDRVDQAAIYQNRSESVLEKTKGLVTLDVEQAFLRYQEARNKLVRFEAGYKQSAKAVAEFKELLRTPEPRNLRQRIETLLNTALIGSQHRLQINESRYQLLIALISLERATGGGFCANLETASPVVEWSPAPNEKPKEKSKEDKKEENTSGKDKNDPKKTKKSSDNSNEMDEEDDSSKKPTKSDKKEDPKKDK